MDLIAQYTIIDHQVLTGLMKLDDDGLINAVMEINNADTDEVCRINKLWDGLHFLLTGVPAQNAPENSPLSRAVLGSHMFVEDDEAFFISYTTQQELPEILDAMRFVDFTALAKKFKPALFREQHIYPDIWHDNHSVALFCELNEAFQSLLEFVETAHASGKNIIFSVY